MRGSGGISGPGELERLRLRFDPMENAVYVGDCVRCGCEIFDDGADQWRGSRPVCRECAAEETGRRRRARR